MYLTQDAAVFAGREPFGFPKKIAYIITQEHGGKEDDGYGGFGNDYFNFTLERRGYLIHTVTGRYDDAELPAKPKFYGDPRYGRDPPTAIRSAGSRLASEAPVLRHFTARFRPL